MAKMIIVTVYTISFPNIDSPKRLIIKAKGQKQKCKKQLNLGHKWHFVSFSVLVK